MVQTISSLLAYTPWWDDYISFILQSLLVWNKTLASFGSAVFFFLHPNYPSKLSSSHSFATWKVQFFMIMHGYTFFYPHGFCQNHHCLSCCCRQLIQISLGCSTYHLCKKIPNSSVYFHDQLALVLSPNIFTLFPSSFRWISHR